jgi:hypothetical protein
MRSLPYLRLLLLLALLASFTGLIVWLIQSFLDLYYATRYHPILGGLLIGVLVLLLLVFLAAAIYYLFLFRQPAPSRRNPLPCRRRLWKSGKRRNRTWLNWRRS